MQPKRNIILNTTLYFQSFQASVNFIVMNVRLKEIWDANQDGHKDGKTKGVCVTFVNI